MDKSVNPYQWGFAIYRTVYTPQSDELWSSVLEKLESYMELSCKDPGYRDELSNIVVWDREKFNNASIDEIRKDFRREMLIPEMGDDEIKSDDDAATEDRKQDLYCQKQAELAEELGDEALWGEVNGSYCLLIDDEVFQSILNAPEPAKGMKMKWGTYEYIGFVKVVTVYERSFRNEHWPGWGKIDFRLLWWLRGEDEIEREAPVPLPEREGVYELPVITGDL
ncbi:hypothetical protein TSTA_080780 [Talaromyces stipitatus ATCC 10500]|uniref:Uncharacterized protein n=1 Tax=Talaromyces stipitatus (strain ATCC 10500 / CBS 375.48 / QM 6759 / NRRL 1006) TaxID=441959 RepID=B8LZR3_TALSN|nr:uncharacterized protein TSTA_080780 [Talaromyces stipitatus ATCC 10500]EED20845.1 hypothetical protein TSTA_080780 [Talaromyces stipitatus ATCC 10500]